MTLAELRSFHQRMALHHPEDRRYHERMVEEIMSRACDDAMKEDLLVEELAERLFEVDNVKVDSRVWAALSVPGRSNWMRLARECLRQMEWAYVKGSPTITLAPPDWTP